MFFSCFHVLSLISFLFPVQFQEISLSDYKGKWVVFFWYPLDFTFVCPTEIIAFGDRQHEFGAINAQVIAASCDSHFSHLAWVNTPRSEGGLGYMKIPILADFNKKVAASYGCLLKDGGIPLRALYIIGNHTISIHCLSHFPTLNTLPYTPTDTHYHYTYRVTVLAVGV